MAVCVRKNMSGDIIELNDMIEYTKMNEWMDMSKWKLFLKLQAVAVVRLIGIRKLT